MNAKLVNLLPSQSKLERHIILFSQKAVHMFTAVCIHTKKRQVLGKEQRINPQEDCNLVK